MPEDITESVHQLKPEVLEAAHRKNVTVLYAQKEHLVWNT